MDADTAKLFPEVNPNIDEIIEREKAVDPNNVIVDEKLGTDLQLKERTTEKDMFVKKKKVQFKDTGKKNVKMEVEEKPKKYSHLAAASKGNDLVSGIGAILSGSLAPEDVVGAVIKDVSRGFPIIAGLTEDF